MFGGERVQRMMDMFKIDDDMPIENKMLTNTIESAQKKVEAQNFNIRKNVLQFDDVMNRQREIIYSQRDKVLDGEDLRDTIMEMLHQSLEKTVENYCPTHAIHDDWNMDGLRNYFLNFLTTEEDFRYTNDQLGELEPKDLVDFLEKRAIKMYEMKEKLITPERMRELERVVLLKTVDRYWMDHIDNMSELKQGIYLRGYGQKDPVTEYKIEGFDMFDAMVEQIREDTVRILMTIRIRTEQEVKREQVAKPTMATHGGEGAKRWSVKLLSGFRR